MSIAIDHGSAQPLFAVSQRATLTVVAGLTSLGAGAIHAAAIGVHAESRPAALAFTLVATLQLSWGGMALVRAGRIVTLLGLLIGTGAVAGWVVAKTSGISFIDGLDVAESIQTADALAAGLAFAGVVLLLLSLRTGRATAAASSSSSSVPRPALSIVAAGVAGIAMFGMVTAGTHVHDHGMIEAGDGGAAPDGHGHGHGAEAASGTTVPGAAGHADGHGDGHGEHPAAVVVPYDPTKPIDLGGVAGVTPEQQAAAENTVAVTLLRLPKWSDPAVAEAAGFHTIGDGFTGVEHFINDAFMDDDVILDPDRPESLVYNTSGGGRRLVAAMYMLKRGTPLSDVPNVGGELMQWHTHENLCYRPNGRLGGLTDANGNCAPGLIKPVPTPMIHVWIEPHKCGPFAALEGVGGGTIAEGEERLCDHAHGK